VSSRAITMRRACNWWSEAIGIENDRATKLVFFKSPGRRQSTGAFYCSHAAASSSRLITRLRGRTSTASTDSECGLVCGSRFFIWRAVPVQRWS
jgi:hypothetical protein